MTKFWLKIAALAAFMVAPVMASAQVSAEPQNGDLVRLNPSNFWKVSQEADLQVTDQVKIADGLHSPTISPDGSRVVLSMLGKAPGENSKLFQWNSTAASSPELIMEGVDVSNYVTWTDNDSFYVRERFAPFFENGRKLNFKAEGKRAAFRDRRTLHEDPVVVFDADDVIVMKHNNKLLAISDVTIDRYSGPMVSSDQNYVVFSGLTTGVNLYDIRNNGVVFQDAKGSRPSFSPDGKYLVYTETADDGHVLTRGDIIIFDIHNKKRMKLSNPTHEIRIQGSLSRKADFIAWENVNGESFKARLNK